METINDRIAWCVKDSKLTKTAFAEKINVGQSFISQLCSGAKMPSDRTIADICREFNISETWLRTGEGEPHIKLNRNEELSAFFGDVLKDQDPDFRRRLLSVMSRLSSEEWALLEQMAQKLVAEMGPAENGQKKTGPK